MLGVCGAVFQGSNTEKAAPDQLKALTLEFGYADQAAKV